MDPNIKSILYTILILVLIVAVIFILFSTGFFSRVLYRFAAYRAVYIGEFNMTFGTLYIYSVGGDYYACINKIEEQSKCIITENNLICDNNNCVKILGYIKT